MTDVFKASPSAKDLETVARQLKEAKSASEKLAILSRLPLVSDFMEAFSLHPTSLEEDLVLKALVACGQKDRLLSLLKHPEKRRVLVDSLLPVERFYCELGGIVGYQQMMLLLLKNRAAEKKSKEKMRFLPPPAYDLTKENYGVREAILLGIQHLPEMGELYVVGGAGDRLLLIDEKDNQPLPAAKLCFLGKTLLQGLIEDVQAREHLYYKLTGKQIITPIALMTSYEKENHRRILDIMDANAWFGRPRMSFRFFTQPLVPVMDVHGRWCLNCEGGLLLKPGGHGVIWKLAEEEGIFDWFASQGRKKALVRQINNPVAGIDYGLLALIGIGCKWEKALGFASCPRLVGSHEGMNLLLDKREKRRCSYVLTNVEYCIFKEYDIEDKSEKRGSPYSKFPSNTNILFVDLKKVRKAVKKSPLPGMLVNLKRATYFDEEGRKIEGEVARLETTMQNIADVMGECGVAPNELQTFLTYNKRKKTISCAKRKYVVGASFLETPEGCFFDVLSNAHELLSHYCGWDVPKCAPPGAFSRGPSFLFFYHPAIGPLYSIIAQKLRKGRLAKGSELNLQIAEVDLEHVDIAGSVAIFSSSMQGKCSLKNVIFRNKGIDFTAHNVYWKNDILRTEKFEIILNGSGEFHAENVTFLGSGKVVVEEGTRLYAQEVRGKVRFFKETVDRPSWSWHYRVAEDATIQLKR